MNMNMNSDHSSSPQRRGDAVSFAEEARRIQEKAQEGQARVVRLGQMVFFSTETGDAWMLDPGGRAVCLARDGEPRSISIQETTTNLAIEWNADYEIIGEAFIVAENVGTAQTIFGYPCTEIQHMFGEAPVSLPGASSDPIHVAQRLKSGRNDPCPCGSGKKYKKCCRDSDEALARQSREARPAPSVSGDDAVFPETADAWQPASDAQDIDRNNSVPAVEPDLSPEQHRADALWEEFQARKAPTVEQMDAFLADLLALSAGEEGWSELFHKFAHHNHPDLPGVFRRIATSVRHTKDSGMAFFYWAATEEFFRRKETHLLPEIARHFQKLNAETYDADALYHLEDYLLACGFEDATRELAEHFLPVMRAAKGLMPYAVPDHCELVFDLRVGWQLRSEPDIALSPDHIAESLRQGIEEEIHIEAVRNAADVIASRVSISVWTRSQFDLVSGDIRSDDEAWRQNLRLYSALMQVVREAWQVEQRAPGCAFHGLNLMLISIYGWLANGRKKKRASENLLEYLRPAGLEPRLVRYCGDVIGINEPRARLLLDAHGILLRFAERHQLISEADAALSHRELDRLLKGLERIEEM